LFSLPICIFDVMIDDFKNFIAREELFQASDHILLAVSGGLDSAAMVSLFHLAGFHFAVAHANFQLRGEESERDEDFVRAMSPKYHVPVYVKRFETSLFAVKSGISLQMAARTLRYDWFGELLKDENFTFVATAHHLDDQVETFLINLTRGTGIAGLHGILPKQGKVIRPLLFTCRAQIEAYARDNKLEFVEDSSNSSDKYLRNRLRHKVIPQLERLSPGFSRELTKTIGFIRDTETIYCQAVEEKKKEIFKVTGDKIFINAEQFFGLRPLTGWAYALLSPYGFNQSNVVDITGLAIAIPGKEVRSTTHRLIKDRKNLILAPLEVKDNDSAFLISKDDLMNKFVKSPVGLYFEFIDEIRSLENDPGSTAFIDFDRLDFPLTIRRWRRGDFFIPLGMSNEKKLSDFFTDKKFSRIEKENTWLMCSGGNIVWIISHRIDDRFKITSSTRKILKITLYPGLSEQETLI
jgi:tRNA(Ile)-lysidine synthase